MYTLLSWMHTPPFTEVDALITDGFPRCSNYGWIPSGYGNNFIEMVHLRRQMLRLWMDCSLHFEDGPVLQLAFTC